MEGTGEQPRAQGRGAPAGDGQPPAPVRRGRHRLMTVLGALGALVVLAVIVAALVPVPYYAITPGQAINTRSMITLPPAQRHRSAGAVLMTDVDLVPLHALEYLYYRWNSSDAVLASSEVTGGASNAQYTAEGVIDMANARQAATVVALSKMGYHVHAVPDGTIVYQPLPGTPAARSLAVGNVITALAGRPTATTTALTSALAAQRPGARVAVVVRGYPGTGVPTRRRQLSVVLGETRVVHGGFACLVARSRRGSAPPAGEPRACLGTVIEQRYRTVGLPFPVTIDSQGIIGPSAGLAFTLGLLDELSHGSLTGGRRIAATGTMTITGAVGDVGGVAQKTVAVRDAGASVFFVPIQEKAVAEAHAGPMKVEAVASLSQALADLRRLGGHLGAPATAQ